MMNVVLNTYSYYTTSLELLENLIAQFVARYKQTNMFAYKLRLRSVTNHYIAHYPLLGPSTKRILSVLAAWMNLESKSLAKHNESKEFVDKFLNFCDEASALATSPQERELLNVLKFFFAGNVDLPGTIPIHPALEMANIEIGNSNTLLETVLNSHYTVEHVAQQLALMDKALFEKIPTCEFLKKNFTKPATSPCYSEMAKRFNHVSPYHSCYPDYPY